MPKKPYDVQKVASILIGEIGKKPSKKRVQLKPKERIFIWEHPEIYGRTCSICNRKITKLSDLELDHTKPHSKGGKKLALAHRDCNRMKGSRNLRDVQKKMGFKTTRRKRQSKRKLKKKKPSSIFDIPEIKLPKGYL